MIKNHDPTQIKPASINIRISALFKIKSQEVIDPEERNVQYQELPCPYTLKPNEYVLAKSIESFNLPPNLCMFHLHRTMAMRIGLSIGGGFADPGYHGEIFFGIKNMGDSDVIIHKNTSLTKVIFFPVQGRTIPLISKYLGGKL